MEITVKEFEQAELITINGRLDSVEAPRLSQALEAANQRGKYKIVVDMSQLEYMSSAGFRALGDAQRNSKRHNRGEVLLVQVRENIREAWHLETGGKYDFKEKADSRAGAIVASAQAGAGG